MKTNNHTKTNIVSINNIEYFDSNPLNFISEFGKNISLLEMDGKMWLCSPVVTDMKREDGSIIAPFRYICHAGEAGEVGVA